MCHYKVDGFAISFICLRHLTESANALCVFSGCPSAAFVQSFFLTDLVTTIFIPTKVREHIFNGAGVCVCLSVCL